MPQLLEQQDLVRETGVAYGNEEYTQGFYSNDVAGPTWCIEQAKGSIGEALLKCRDELMSGLHGIK